MPNSKRGGGSGRSHQGHSGLSQNKNSRRASRQASASARTAPSRKNGHDNAPGVSARARRDSAARMDENRELSRRSGAEEGDLDAEDTAMEFADRDEDEDEKP